MKHVIPIVVVGALLLLAAAIFLWNRWRYPDPIPLPGKITTLTAGLTFALQMKDQIAPDTHLASVHIDFDRQGIEFSISEIAYVFASTEKDGRVLAIAIDNVKHEAYVSLDAPNSPDNPPYTLSRSTPLDLSLITQGIPEILEIAKSYGLDEFCALAPPRHGTVACSLGNSDSRFDWKITGDGWDEQGPIADLAITIDAQTGAVLSHNLQKAVGRP
jgi:hypothetical protein